MAAHTKWSCGDLESLGLLLVILYQTGVSGVCLGSLRCSSVLLTAGCNLIVLN